MFDCFLKDQFGSLEWSHSETHLLYVAERKVPKTKSYFDEKPETGSGSAPEIEKVTSSVDLCCSSVILISFITEVSFMFRTIWYEEFSTNLLQPFF